MIIGPHYSSNQKRFSTLKEDDWKVVLRKSAKHIRIRLKQKTLSGAHSAGNLGTNPVDHYLEVAYTKLLGGEWEWKEKFTLLEQMIRLIDHEISAVVEKFKTPKSKALRIEYTDITDEFYIPDDTEITVEEEAIFNEQSNALKSAATGDAELEMIYEAICEGMKRADIAELLGKTPKQFDKLKEKLVNKVKKHLNLEAMPTNKQILNNLYGLMLEINYQQEDQDVLAELEAKPDAYVSNHLLKIKQLTAKLKAEANRQRYAAALTQLQLLKQKGIEEFKKLFNPSDQSKLVPMFNRFTELSKKDEREILEDEEMLHFMEILKERANDTDSNNG